MFFFINAKNRLPLNSLPLKRDLVVGNICCGGEGRGRNAALCGGIPRPNCVVYFEKLKGRKVRS